jgi:hypothetical protein
MAGRECGSAKPPRAGTQPSTHSTAQASVSAALTGLPLPGTVPQQPVQPKPTSRRRKKAAALPSSSSGDAKSTSSSSSEGQASQPSRKPSRNQFEAALAQDLGRYGMNLGAPRKQRPPPRDRSGAAPAAGQQQVPASNSTPLTQTAPARSKVRFQEALMLWCHSRVGPGECTATGACSYGTAADRTMIWSLV